MEKKTFEYYGFKYETINETEVNLIDARRANGKTYIPSEVEDKEGNKYKVVGIERSDYTYRYLKTPDDKRKKPYYTYGTQLLSPFISKNNEGFNCSESLEVIIPDSVTSIGCRVFQNCKGLKSIVFGAGITTIEEYAFEHSGLISVKIPDTVTYIGQGAFDCCEDLSSIKLPSNLQEVPNKCCFACHKLKDIQFPSKVTKICKSAFALIGATEISLPSSVSHLDDGAFFTNQSIVVNIYNDAGRVIIHPNAFSSKANVVYLGYPQRKAETVIPKQSEAKVRTAKSIDLNKLINAVVVDGVVTEKERSVLLRKAKEAGYDVDEVEILLDAKLYEAQQKACSTQPVANEIIKEKVIESTAHAEVTTDTSSDTDEVPWAEILWTPLKGHLDKVTKIKGSKPADRSYTIYRIKTIDAQIVPWYKVKTNEAGVALETYGGNEVKSIIEKILSKAPANSIVRQAELSQGKKNKDKWNWTVIANIDKNDSGIIQWYADAILAFSSLIDG